MSVAQKEPAASAHPEGTKADGELRLTLDDTLASANRLWVRGSLQGTESPETRSGKKKGWWLGRWNEASPPPVPINIETRISGKLLEAQVSLGVNGRFEVMFSADLPVARRGWRVARYQVSSGKRTALACGLVIEVPRDAQTAILVLLPVQFTHGLCAAQHLSNSDFAARLTPLLQTLKHGAEGAKPIYYLACVPCDRPSGQAELALAVISLGWPKGQLILLPTGLADVKPAFLTAVDRLRWLFSGHLSLLVLNLEPMVAPGLLAPLAPREDRAIIQKVVNPQDDPWVLIDKQDGQRNGKTVGQSRTLGFRRLPTSAYGQADFRPSRSNLLPKNPIVFCHGMLAYSMMRMELPDNPNYFSPLGDFFRQRGYRVFFPQLPPTSGVVERADHLREQILRWTDEPINLIAHSMGGLDARYLITHLGMANKVCSLTTICTPHRGSYMADWFQANFRQRVPLLLALEAFGLNVDGFRDCRPEVCQEFNARTPNMPGVRYFSFGGSVNPAHVTPVLRRAWNLLYAVEGPNDGLVSVASANWGEYLGTIYADHFAQTPDGLYVRQGEDFDSLSFFSRLVEDLARRGF